MFTGIVEGIGIVESLTFEGQNLRIGITSEFTADLYVDQSIAHNGICLTVESIKGNRYQVVAVLETLRRTNLKDVQVGSKLNLERSVTNQQRLDGHIVQGHVDTTLRCIEKYSEGGSWIFSFEYADEHHNLLVDKGSVCINGTSLTVISPENNAFKVAIIPYTYEHTSFSELSPDQMVNIEFDIIGKYVQRNLSNYIKK